MKVISNLDPERMGQVQVETGKWLRPVTSGLGEFPIPQEGKQVFDIGGYYLAQPQYPDAKFYYVVSIKNNPWGWYIKGENGTGWSKTKKEATAFPTKTEAYECLDRLETSCGRGEYKVIRGV